MSTKHLSAKELSSRLSKAQQKVDTGATYLHYKNQNYIVLDLAIQESDNEVVVVYEADYGNRIKFTRPLSSWLENVQWQGKTLPRFIKLKK
jgi:hypothetical protein